MSVAWCEFSKGIAHLCGSGTQRERLALACCPAVLGMNRKEIPREARADFDLLLRLMGSQLGARSAGDLVDHLSDSEVALAVAKVLALYDQLTRYQPTQTAFDEMHGLPPRLAKWSATTPELGEENDGEA